jgi:hypothetical protein
MLPHLQGTTAGEVGMYKSIDEACEKMVLVKKCFEYCEMTGIRSIIV